MIELTDFTKIYRSGLFRKTEKAAVSNVSMKCFPDSITGLLGPNGAGKTTILKAICAYHFATSGKVVVENHDAKEETEAVKRCTGFVEEQSLLPNEYTVKEYLSFCALHQNLNNIELKNAVERVVENCSLAEVMTKKIGHLSKGYKQRVSFAKALISNPPVLVLDEPVSGLDPAQIVKMRELIKNLSKGRTVILSTHLMQEAEALCTNLYIVSKGICVGHGTSESIMQETKTSSLEDAFLLLTNNDKEKI